MRIAIIGGGIAGLTAAYELSRLAVSGSPVEAVLFEGSNRFGGILDTVREGGFTIEGGPDAWVTAKPWARELAIELGLESELLPSNDATRKTWLLQPASSGPAHLVAMPDRMNMMVPTDLDALTGSALFTPEAIAAYRAEPARAAELLAQIPPHDESIADFTLRHFGPEVLNRVAAPLLAGVFGGNVHTLSVRAVMPAFVGMERTHGSLIAALQATAAHRTALPEPIFTTLRTGMGTLIDRLVAAIPPHWLRLNATVTSLQPNSHLRTENSQLPRWLVSTTDRNKQSATERFDAVFLATPVDASRGLLTAFDPASAALLPTESSSAVLVAFAFPDATRIPLPPGFGFLVPPEPSIATHNSQLTTHNSLLLACTFVDQKFPHRVPPGGRLIRAFFGGAAAERVARCNNDEVAAIARAELARILNASAPLSGPAPTPLPAPVVTVVRRWPHSLPQYAVGHLDRIAELRTRLAAHPGLILLGNALHGVGIPDLIHSAREAARTAAYSVIERSTG
jgi:oxygen-dependent protoporphyrinogen oxidase